MDRRCVESFLLALLYGNFIVLALLLSGSVSRVNILKSKILEWLGLRSYGIYLLHKPVQILIPFILAWFLLDPLSAWALVIVSTIVLFAIAELSYRMIEKPIMSLGHYFQYK